MAKLLTAVACATALTIGIMTDASAQSFDGAWASVGYGVFLDVAGSKMTGYEVTKISCLQAFTATRNDEPGGVLSFAMVEEPAVLWIRDGGSPDVRRVHFDGSASDVVVRRLSSKPAACASTVTDTPLSNFDVFARTWAEQYGFFDLKRADWAAIVADHRSRVTETTTPEALFDVLTSMIAPFNDAHTSIRAEKIGKTWNGARRSATWLERSERPSAFEVVEQKYLRGPLRSWCKGQVQYGRLEGGVAYLRLKSFSGYGDEEGFASGLVALEAALDAIFAESQSWSGLIIDVRINGGGADPYGLAIASRLATREYVAYSKEARSDPDDPSRWTEAQPSRVQPSSRAGFKGTVVELIGIHSVSAAETFTQALLKREPAVTRVGENTQGVFSDVLGRRLPNGWRFGLPNERFLTDGRSFDGPGIPPDIEVPVFPKSDLSAGRDGALEKALGILGVRRGRSQ